MVATDYEKHDDGTVTITIDGIDYRITPAGDGQVQITATTLEPGTVTDALNHIIKEHQRQDAHEQAAQRVLDNFKAMIP